MKKSLIIIMTLVFILGVTCTVLAAPGPFADVPADNWSYGAINQLYKAGIIEGYQGSYRGNKTMTRYEMAQIVARAMEKSDKADATNKALIDKLSIEFAAELNNLGVRVTTLEKKVGNVALSGDAAIRYIDWSRSNVSHAFQENFRLAMTAPINDDTNMFGRVLIMRQNTFGQNSKNNNYLIEGGFKIQKFLGQDDTLILGRFNQVMSATGNMMNYWGVDGAKVAFGNKLKVELGYASFQNPSTSFGTYNMSTGATAMLNQTYNQLFFDNAMFATLNYALGDKTTLFGEYLTNNVNTSPTGASHVNVWGLGVAQKLGSNFIFKGDYIKNYAYSNQNTAVYAILTYKGADPNQPHSWGISTIYNKAYGKASFGWGDFNATQMYLTTDIQNYVIRGDYTPAKNIILKVSRSFNSKIPETNVKDKNGEWTRAQIDFLF